MASRSSIPPGPRTGGTSLPTPSRPSQRRSRGSTNWRRRPRLAAANGCELRIRGADNPEKVEQTKAEARILGVIDRLTARTVPQAFGRFASAVSRKHGDICARLGIRSIGSVPTTVDRRCTLILANKLDGPSSFREVSFSEVDFGVASENARNREPKRPEAASENARARGGRAPVHLDEGSSRCSTRM